MKLKIPPLHGVRNRRSVGKFKQVQLLRCAKIPRGESNPLDMTHQIKNKSLTTWSESRSHSSPIMHSLSDSACAGRQSAIVPERNHHLLAPKTRTNYNTMRKRVRPTWETFLVPRRRTHYNPMRSRVGRNRLWHGAMRWLFVRHGGAVGGGRRTVWRRAQSHKNLQKRTRKWLANRRPKVVPKIGTKSGTQNWNHNSYPRPLLFEN